VPQPSFSATTSPRSTPAAQPETTGPSRAQTAALDDSGGEATLDGFPTAPGQTLGPDASALAAPIIGGDFTWNVATLPVLGETLVNVSSGPNPTLTVFNSGTTEVTIRLSQEDASLPDVTIPADGVRAVLLVPGARYSLFSEVAVYAAVNYAAKGLGASVPLSPASPLGSGIMVYPR
jgi:hypothetical protein